MMEVDEDAPCRVCGDVGWEEHDPFVFCDRCNLGFHISCAGEEAMPPGEWFCRACSGRPTPDFKIERSKRPKLNKRRLREEAGLYSAELDQRQQLARFLQQSEAPSTRAKKEATRARFINFCARMGRQDKGDEPETIALFVLERVRQEVAFATIEAEVAVLRSDAPTAGGSELVREALKAAKRLAEVPDEAKEPITYALLRELRAAIKGFKMGLTDTEAVQHIRVRDWTFYLLGFIGMFRGSELASLEWTHLRFAVKGQPQELEIASIPQGVQLEHVTVTVVKSKQDVEGRGQDVRIVAVPRQPLSDCPVQLLLHLWAKHRRPGQTRVFAEARSDYEPGGLTADCFRGRLKNYLKTFMTADQVERYSLHSLRRGGATAAAAKQIDIRLIKLHGRWRSDAVYLYTLVSDREARQVSDQLLAELRQG